MQASPNSAESIREQLRKILSSALFESAGRSRALLTYVVEQTVNHQADRLKEYTLGVEALGRGDGFDPRTDPIVRAEVSRLRSRLERYYGAEGRGDPITIVLPKGTYIPQFLDGRILEETAQASISVSPPLEAPRATRFRWLAVGVLALACVAGIGIWSRRLTQPPESSLAQFDIELKARGEVGSEVGTDVILSPDGARLVYVSLGVDGVTRLNTRRLAQSQATELQGTEGARVPFFSPDGGWVGFEASGKLKKTSVDGGLPVTLCDAGLVHGASWGEDGNIVASLGRAQLSRIPATGGPPAAILDLTAESAAPEWPQVLPGAKVVIFTAVSFSGPNGARIEALSLTTGERKVLARGGTYGRYLPNRFVTYVNQGTLYALPFDLDRMEASGTPTAVLEGVSYSSTFGFAQLDFSRSGALVYRKNGGGQVIAEWLDASGKIEPLHAKPGRYLWPRMSPNGERLAFQATESGLASVWMYDWRTDQTTRLTATAGRSPIPLWSPDGRFLILGGVGSGLTWVLPDSAGKPETLTHSNKMQVPWSFSPNGSRLAYHELNPATGFDIWTVPIQASGSGLKAGDPEPFLQTPAAETYPSFSSDGRWIAYGSNESGSWEVYVRAFPDNGRKVQVSDAGGRIPRWSPSGRDLFYRTDDQRIMVATYTTQGGTFVVDSKRQWSQGRLADTGVLSNFDLSPNGRRILALMPALRSEDRQTENHVTFVLNFADEVRRRVAAGGR